jgi:hypothetical protein
MCCRKISWNPVSGLLIFSFMYFSHSSRFDKFTMFFKWFLHLLLKDHLEHGYFYFVLFLRKIGFSSFNFIF